MSYAVAYSRASQGIAAPLVTIEVHISGGLPKITLVGLPEAAVKESKDRVRGALLNMNFEFPQVRLTINLAPADLPKEGGRFDLAIALGILAASHQLPKDKLLEYEFAGELALSGELRAVKGILPFALLARERGKILILPKANADEAALVSGLSILPAEHFLEVFKHLTGKAELNVVENKAIEIKRLSQLDFSDVIGQPQAKRALEIAAAGEHSLLLTGPPGTGKTMLASRLNSILPAMTEEEALEAAAIASISRKGFSIEQWKRRAFRHPHHSASSVALVGGGNPPRPGEISLAHRGILFLDELPEFQRHVLEALREPLESGCITISRAAYQAEFPARFQFIAAMNPCPCGYAGDAENMCMCTAEQITRYRRKISGPILDRVDLQVQVPRIPGVLLNKVKQKNEASAEIKARVCFAREKQIQRAGRVNSLLTRNQLENALPLSSGARALMEKVVDKLKLSARAYYRVLKVSLTIADLAGTDAITEQIVSEALSYRL